MRRTRSSAARAVAAAANGGDIGQHAVAGGAAAAAASDAKPAQAAATGTAAPAAKAKTGTRSTRARNGVQGPAEPVADSADDAKPTAAHRRRLAAAAPAAATATNASYADSDPSAADKAACSAPAVEPATRLHLQPASSASGASAARTTQRRPRLNDASADPTADSRDGGDGRRADRVRAVASNGSSDHAVHTSPTKRRNLGPPPPPPPPAAAAAADRPPLSHTFAASRSTTQNSNKDSSKASAAAKTSQQKLTASQESRLGRSASAPQPLPSSQLSSAIDANGQDTLEPWPTTSSSLGDLDMLLDDLPGPGSAQTHSAPLKRIALLKPSSRPTPAVTAGSDLALAASGSLSGNASLPSLASSSLDAAESTFAFTPAQPIQRQGAADVNGRFLTMQSLPSTFDEDGVDESPAQPAGRPATLRSPNSIEKTPLARSMSSPTPSPAIGITRLRLGGPTLLRGTGAPQPRSRRRSNLLTFGQNRTVMQSMRSAPLSDSPTSAVGNSLASLVDENEEEDEAPASAKIDEGLSSSDDDAPKVRSIHELREAGESKRFRDEMSYFFESLEPSQAQRLRRFTAIELARKLNTAKFVNNLRAHACTKTVFDLLVGSDDPFLRLFVVYFLWVLSHDVRNIEPLFACPELASAVVQALVVPVDRDLLLTLPKAKADAAIVQDLQSIMATSPRVLAMGVQSSEISMFSLGLDILAELSMVRGHLSVSLQEQLHSARAVAVIANRTTDLAFQAATRGKTETSQLKKHLRILEFATVRRGGAVVSGTEAERLAESLLALMSSTFPAVLDGSPTQAELLALDLRVVLNLANSPDCRVAMDHTQWIAVLLDLLVKLQQQRSRVSGGDKNDPAAGRHFLSSTAKPATAPLFDHMLLCISLLTNLIELHSPCAQVLLDSQIRSGACTGGKACKRTCKCTTTRPALDVIMAILQEQLDDASDAADAFVLTAHLGALFASVLKQSQKAVQVSKAVRGATWDSLVAATADVLRDFIEFHERVAAEHVTLSESEDHGVAATRKSLLSLLACLDGLAAASSD